MAADSPQLPSKASGVLAAVPAPLLFIGAGFSQYTGAAFAVSLFDAAPPVAVAWIRAAAAGIVLCALIRPWRKKWDRSSLKTVVAFGLALTMLNALFYVSIAFIPMGAAVAIEFIGPIAVAAWGSKTWRSWFAIALATAGVIAISILGVDWGTAGLDLGGDAGKTLLGVAAALGAGAFWGMYMVLANRVASTGQGNAALAMGMVVSGLVFLPIGLPLGFEALRTEYLGAIFGMAILSSVVPYLLDQVAVKRLGTSVFALLTALLPATASVVGFIALEQLPSIAEAVGIIAIMAAVVLAMRPEVP